MRKALRPPGDLRLDPFFQDLSEDALARVKDYVYHREYEPHQIVYFPDDPCDYAYWVRKGRVRVTRISPDGRQVTFRHLHPGDLFGEECLVESPRRDAYAEALDATVLCLMRAADFRRVAREEAEVCFLLAKLACRRAQQMENVWAESVFKTVRSRIAAGLLRLYRQAAEEGPAAVRITHQEIANLVGTTRETTTTVLHGFRQEGILELGNRRVRVLDTAALEHAARSNA